MEGTAVYVYAIGRQDQLRKLLDAGDIPQGLVGNTPVALVTSADLAAVVSEVPLTNFGEGRFEEHLKDPAWAAEKVMRHEKLAEFLAAKSTIVPLRFGVMYSTPELIREMLHSRQARLVGVLDRLANREEWGLNIYVDRKILLEQMPGLSPRLAELQRRARASSPGQAYLLEKKLESLRVSESRTETKRVVHSIRTELEAEPNLTKELPVREHESAQDPAVAAKLSFLIERKGQKAFRMAAEKLAKKYAGFGFSLELTGPWPPYNFSE